METTPDKDHIYGLYDPEGSGYTFYATEKERDDAAEEAIQGYLDDIWFDEVEGVFAFTVTARAAQVDVRVHEPLNPIVAHARVAAFAFTLDYVVRGA